MHFNNLCLMLCSMALFTSTLGKAQDTITVLKDSIVATDFPSGEASYRNFLYLSGQYFQSVNDEFYDDLFPNGVGLLLGIPLYSQKYYTIRFNVGLNQFKLDNVRYAQSDSLAVLVESRPMQVVAFLPDVVFHPFENWLVSPYLNGGVGLLVGSKDPSVNVKYDDGNERKITLNFGTRYQAQFGGGAFVHISNYVHLFVGALYNIEFLENSQSEDIFYKFTATKDFSYKYLQYQLGVQLKLKK